jgi:hypothetical protein
MRHQTTFHPVVLRRFVAGAVVLAAVLVVGGAGSSVAAVGAPSSGPVFTHHVAATRSGTSRSGAGVLVDQRIARDARLRLSDLPPGWVAQNTASTLTANAPCPGLRRAAADISAGMISPDFSGSTGHPESAQTETDIYADSLTAKHWFNKFSSHGTVACLLRVLRNELAAAVSEPGVTVGSITVRGLPVAPVGDQRAAFRVTVPVIGPGVRLKVDADLVFVRAGRGLEFFSLAGVGSPFDPRLEGTLVKTVAARLAADLRSAP